MNFKGEKSSADFILKANFFPPYNHAELNPGKRLAEGAENVKGHHIFKLFHKY